MRGAGRAPVRPLSANRELFPISRGAIHDTTGDLDCIMIQSFWVRLPRPYLYPAVTVRARAPQRCSAPHRQKFPSSRRPGGPWCASRARPVGCPAPRLSRAGGRQYNKCATVRTSGCGRPSNAGSSVVRGQRPTHRASGRCLTSEASHFPSEARGGRLACGRCVICWIARIAPIVRRPFAASKRTTFRRSFSGNTPNNPKRSRA